jgi:predicted metal-dependent hydrolase
MSLSTPPIIEHTKNKTSRAVFRDGQIIIRLARGLTQGQQKKHVDTLMKRMVKAVERHEKKIHIDPFQPIVERLVSSLTVKTILGHSFVFKVIDGSKTMATQIQRGWSVTRSSRISQKAFRQFLWKLLSESCLQDVEALVYRTNQQTFDISLQKVSLKHMRSRWGSCSVTGKIVLSTALLFTTVDILRSTIIHELAHRIRMDHSQKFWSTVELYDPDHKKYTKMLHQFSL